ncbi:hypothetical protein DL546_008225 [Coniochaeta pulveracea]|uniref:Uncharacterized protein n=1 Tax=Coniochaeta pulveracea TaxID=177199 RepID=A0A420YJL2_9PEZI|nr:hypothetical protein DL546_008225 [Coniochaeta pulveracea]
MADALMEMAMGALFLPLSETGLDQCDGPQQGVGARYRSRETTPRLSSRGRGVMREVGAVPAEASGCFGMAEQRWTA